MTLVRLAASLAWAAMAAAAIDAGAPLVSAPSVGSAPTWNHHPQAGKRPVALPEQVHLALGPSPSSMTVMWVTQDASAAGAPADRTAVVSYGPGPAASARQDRSSLGVTEVFPVPVSWEVSHDFIRANISRRLLVHRATMTGLRPRTEYSYRVGGNLTGWSAVFSFTSAPVHGAALANRPVKVAWLGDLGGTNGRSLALMKADAASGTLDAFIHVGDIAYDLDTRADEAGRAAAPGEGNPPPHNTGIDGGVGDAFMRELQPIAARVPYMVCPGNHEFNFNFTAFTHRFNGMPVSCSSFCPARTIAPPAVDSPAPSFALPPVAREAVPPPRPHAPGQALVSPSVHAVCMLPFNQGQCRPNPP